MIKVTCGVPVKTRLPLTAWILAALVTLFSMVSSLVPSPSPHMWETRTEANQASLSW